ncbi:putative serine/threonine-protein kinase GCN2 isoform X2 [Carex littledalei]|uniref:non-specific serine/threonine protein kinase n=1 Tax=Carex littledalei TaxID=544730 RepID=A0A833R3N4_9POAL|nr:putative serine/threonine-protein kinase GCN2 isoform X2 [Carex littledalei]
MGHNSKKKKKAKGGRGRGRNPSKDHSSQLEDDQDVLNEELTVLASIFQGDFKIISDVPNIQIQINLRPYSGDISFGNHSISAALTVRYLPGYPHKCPKIQLAEEEGLSEENSNKLLSLILDQANICAKEGRVMIYNLVEAAQEFLSEIVPFDNAKKSAPFLESSKADEPLIKSSPFSVCSSIDLYSDLAGDTTWGGQRPNLMDETSSKSIGHHTDLSDMRKGKNVLLQPTTLSTISTYRQVPSQSLPKHGSLHEIASKLDAVSEEGENDSETDEQSVSGSSDRSSSGTPNLFQDIKFGEEVSDENSQSSTSSSFALITDDASQNKKKDLLLVHFLRMASAFKGSPSIALSELSSEMCNIGVLSDWARDLVKAPPSVFLEAFNHTFEKHAFAQFLKSGDSFDSENASSRSNSRYLNDFQELRSLGHGGFGHVALCQNKLDGRQYALKKIRLKDKNPLVNDKILREVATLSRLQHQHVVRYYQSWFETSYGSQHEESVCGSMTESTSFSNAGVSSGDPVTGNMQESTYLYIQMEYCPRTLRQDLETYTSSFNKDYAWHMFRQILEGLAHIHSQGIIHRDLTPSNIFFDGRNDIKIGDFGLAKFLKLEQLDHDQYLPTNTTGASMDGTGQVGTYFYTAPEIEQKWPQINEKVDMYSLGVIFFELWHPFATAMERHIILSDLKLKGTPPTSWVEKFPTQALLLSRLMAPSPSDRPSAIEVLQNDLPPRMEDEWLSDVLRMIQTPEDTYVLDRVVSTIFNEERLINKSHQQQEVSTKTMQKDFFTQSSELDYELQDTIIEVSKEVFKRHCAKRLGASPLQILDGTFPFNRKTVKLMTQGGNMLELCHELRSPFVLSISTNQITSFKRYEVAWVYRRAIGRSTPSRFLQGDFDIIGGAPLITEAEVIKVALDIGTRIFSLNAIDIKLNHGLLLESIWSWVHVPTELRQSVAELLSLIGPLCPQSTNRKSNWKFIRRQLLQDLHLSEGIVDRLQTADLRFCGSADQVLARLRGALSSDKSTCKALEDLSNLLSYLKVWSIESNVTIDVLMPPSETYYTGVFFQMYLKESNPGSSPEATLLAIGGRYDQMMEQMWGHDSKSNPPGAVGVSIALEKFLHSSSDIRTSRIEPGVSVLVCSRGGGGLLEARMEFVAELWQANIRAQFVPHPDPSLKEQYEYASEHDIKCLLIITEAGLSQTDLVKVRHLELKKEKEVPREEIVKFLTDAISTQFRDHTIWS